MEYLKREEFVALFEKTARVSDLRATDFDAIVVVGGQSPMFTFKDAVGLQALFMYFFRSGKPSAALCHGTSLLLYLKNPDGTPFVKGRKMTGFANSEEDYADKAVGQKVMPFRIEDEARTLGAHFTTKPAFQPYAVRDGNLITGQQQHSGGEVAKLVISVLEGGEK
jgi:putative intracellular protease/amidase